MFSSQQLILPRYFVYVCMQRGYSSSYAGKGGLYQLNVCINCLSTMKYPDFNF